MKLTSKKAAKLSAIIESATKRLCEKDDEETGAEAEETFEKIGNSLDEFVEYVTANFFGAVEVDMEKLGKLKKDKAEEMKSELEDALKTAKKTLGKIFKAVMAGDEATSGDEEEKEEKQTDEAEDADSGKDTEPEDEPKDKDSKKEEDPSDIEIVDDDEEQTDESVETVDEAATIPGVSVDAIRNLVQDYHLAYSTERGALAKKVVDVLANAKKYAPDTAKVEQYAYTEIGRLLVYFGGEYDEMDADEFTDMVFNMAAATGIYGEELKKKAAEYGKPEHDRTDLEDEWDSDPDAGFPDWN